MAVPVQPHPGEPDQGDLRGTPFAFLDSEMRASITGKNGGVAQDKAIARMVAGSAIMGYFVHQALNGRATGDYPHDPKERDSLEAAGQAAELDPDRRLLGVVQQVRPGRQPRQSRGEHRGRDPAPDGWSSKDDDA
jgi:hypothetical protein